MITNVKLTHTHTQLKRARNPNSPHVSYPFWSKICMISTGNIAGQPKTWIGRDLCARNVGLVSPPLLVGRGTQMGHRG